MTEDITERIVKWWTKIEFLKDQIDKLGNLKDFSVFAISAFLLKCQIVEFELKQLIFSMNFHLYSQNSSKLFRKKIKTPKDLDNLTMYKLVIEAEQFIDTFENPIKASTSSKKSTLRSLKINLKKLVNKRDKFTHHLFDVRKDLNALNVDALVGIDLANKSLELIKNLQEEIKMYEDKDSS